MPIPSNQTAETAIDVGSLPASVTQRVDSGGTTYDVWYKYTAQPGETEIGVWAFGDLSVYTPTCDVNIGPASAPVNYYDGVDAVNVPFQLPVTPGETYYFKIITNGGNPTPANLTLSVETAPTTTTSAGDILVPDDSFTFENDNYPAVIVGPTTDYDVLRFSMDIIPCEFGDTLDDGTILTNDSTVAGAGGLNLYDTSFNRTHITYTGGPSIEQQIRTCKGLQIFYFSDAGDIGLGVNSSIYKVSAAGVITTVAANLGAVGYQTAAAKNDGTHVYLADGTVGAAVKDWNVAGAAFGADFAAGLANHIVSDMLVLSDGTVVVAFLKLTATKDVTVKVYNSTGTVLQTISYGSNVTGSRVRLAYALDDPTTFWLWVHQSSPSGATKFIKYIVATGATSTTINNILYSQAVFQEAATATPPSRFGISDSCPFIVMRSAINPPSDDASGIYWISPGKTFDELFHGTTGAATVSVKIPDPTVILFPSGD